MPFVVTLMLMHLEISEKIVPEHCFQVHMFNGRKNCDMFYCIVYICIFLSYVSVIFLCCLTTNFQYFFSYNSFCIFNFCICYSIMLYVNLAMCIFFCPQLYLSYFCENNCFKLCILTR